MSDCLKNCPFCGKKPEWYGVDEHRDRIQCSNDACPIQPHTESRVETNQLPAAWNTRADRADRDAHLALLRRCYEALTYSNPFVLEPEDIERHKDVIKAVDAALAQSESQPPTMKGDVK